MSNISEKHINYFNSIKEMNLYQQAMEAMNIESDEEIKGIVNIIDSEILLKRRDIVHSYGSLTDLIELINDEIKDNNDNDPEYDHQIESLIESIDTYFSNIEDYSIELESYLKAKEFAMNLYNIE